MSFQIPEEAVAQAFDWLKEASDVVAAAKVNVLRKKFRAAKVHSRLLRHAEGAMELRKAWATDHPDYEAAMNEFFEASEIWEQLEDRQNKCSITIEAWRSQEASNRNVIRSGR